MRAKQTLGSTLTLVHSHTHTCSLPHSRLFTPTLTLVHSHTHTCSLPHSHLFPHDFHPQIIIEELIVYQGSSNDKLVMRWASQLACVMKHNNRIYIKYIWYNLFQQDLVIAVISELMPRQSENVQNGFFLNRWIWLSVNIMKKLLNKSNVVRESRS